LYDAPAYHTGLQAALGDRESDAKTWVYHTLMIFKRQSTDTPFVCIQIEVVKHRPYRSDEERKMILGKMASVLDGYVATADPPLSLLTPELLELYPEAQVVCTVRDVETWKTSMEFIANAVPTKQFRFIFFWIRNLRYCAVLWDMLGPMFVQVYGAKGGDRESSQKIWDKHHAWLEENVGLNPIIDVLS
jgi:hypothetical protein